MSRGKPAWAMLWKVATLALECVVIAPWFHSLNAADHSAAFKVKKDLVCVTQRQAVSSFQVRISNGMMSAGPFRSIGSSRMFSGCDAAHPEGKLRASLPRRPAGS